MTEQNSLEPRRYSFSSNALEPAASPRSPELPRRAGARHFHGKKSKAVHQGKNLWLQRESTLGSRRRKCDQKRIHQTDFCEAGLFKRPVYEPNDLVAETEIVVVKEAEDTELVVEEKKEAKRQEEKLDDEGKEEVELQVRQEEEQSLKEEEIKVDEEEVEEEEEEENHNGEVAPKLALFHNNICEGRCDPFPPVEV